MDIEVNKSSINGCITAPPSKSYAHREIICAFLSNSETTVYNIGSSSDVLETVSALKEVGANITIKDGNCYIGKSELKKSAVIKINESASTFRFLLPVFCALGIKAKFVLGKQLEKRPNEMFISLLNSFGADIQDFKINGKLKAGTFFLDASLSSQFISGLLFALPLLEEKSEIIFTKKLVSTGYVDITLDVLSSFSVFPKKTKNGFTIEPANYISIKEITVEGDYSSASVMLSLGAIGGNVSIVGLKENSFQGDKKIIDVLKNFGAKIYFFNGILKCEKDKLNGITVDVENIIDLAPIIAVIGAFACGKTTLENVKRLKIKESDRLKSIIDFLTKANIKTELKNNALTVFGGKGTVNSFNTFSDHRIEMAEVVLSTFLEGTSIIKNAFNVNKSYTDFYDDYKILGGNINVKV